MHHALNIQTLGEPRLLAGDGSRIEGLLRHRKRLALFLYMACDENRGVCRRDHLLGVFWPDGDEHDARNSLRQSIHVIRTHLGPEILEPRGESDLLINRNAFRCDALSFVRALAGGRNEHALSLYAGDFLDGFQLDDAPEFNFWADRVRNRLKRLAGRAARDLAHTAEGRRSLEDALFWWRRALELDPFDEVVLRRVLTLLAASGNRAGALAEFDRFRSLLADQLDGAPSAQTIQLVRDIRSERAERISPWVGDRRQAPTRPGNGHRRRLADLTPP